MPAFLDANIFLYAIGGQHPQREACAALLKRVGDGSFNAITSTEVVQELLFVVARRSSRREAVELATEVAALFPDLLPVTRGDMLRACEIIARHPHLSIRDAVHAATMLNNGLNTLVSVDSDFDQIAGIQRILPTSL